MIDELCIGGRKCRLFGADNPALILIQPSARHENATLEAEARMIAELSDLPFVLATIELEDWTLDLMPWWDGNISRDPEAGKRGQETLEYILSELVPELEKLYGHLPLIIGGYSLGGLFALWASMQTDTFNAVAAASPSVWIHNWLPYAKKHVPMADDVYLSLGDQEERVRNQAIARVGDNLRAQFELLKEQLGQEHCALVWERGNHFSDSEGRLARAFAWCFRAVESPSGKNMVGKR